MRQTRRALLQDSSVQLRKCARARNTRRAAMQEFAVWPAPAPHTVAAPRRRTAARSGPSAAQESGDSKGCGRRLYSGTRVPLPKENHAVGYKKSRFKVARQKTRGPCACSGQRC
jgi:hypothetical protein